LIDLEWSGDIMAKQKGKMVFSTRSGDLRKEDTAPAGPLRSLPPAQQNLKIMRETKGRRGKMVTVISGFTLTQADLTSLAKTLKTLCGSGGTAKNEASAQVIELQGDHREKVAEKLTSLGYKVKFAGG
jgi:translation initiation factor 1